MKTGIGNVLQVAAAVLALGASGFAMAADQGIAGRIAGKAREQSQQASERRESRPAQAQRPAQPQRPAQAQRPAQPQRPAQSPPQARPAQPRAESRPAPRNESRPAPRNESRQTPRNAPQAAAGTGTNERRNRTPSGGNAGPTAPAPQTSAGSAPRSDRGVAGTLIQREYQTRDPRPDRNDRGNDRGRDWDRDRGGRDWDRDRHNGRYDRPRRTVHVIHHLPSGYRDYAWNGTHYYYHGGSWYRPYGSSYVSVSVPYGFFVATLPGSYTSVWVGGTRYYYSDDYYYTYEPARRGYVMVRSPYGDDEDEYAAALDEDLYVYPAQGQSEQQQADDRYECHRWAVAETNYDPIDDEYDADLRQDYLRALTACLTGRGYTVR